MSKKSLVDSIEVKTPCSEDWNEMKGNDNVRFCSHCAFEVNNISTMTRRQALRLVRRSEGRICVRYVKDPVNNEPIFARKLHQISRRAGIAAGVLGASLTLSTVTYAQGSARAFNQTSEKEVSTETQFKKEKTQSATASISGTITDPNGAVIPGATVVLRADGLNRVTTTNDEGFYEFTYLPAGKYSIAVAHAGFKTANAARDLAENSTTLVDISLEVGATMGIMITIEYATPLHQAVSNDDLETVKNLIRDGADVDLKDENYGITPLFIAVENNDREMVELLLNSGANVNALSDNKQTPLMRLDDDATPELVLLLIKHGANIHLTDARGNTALIFAANSVEAKVLQILLDHNADVNAQNEEGQTALMNAADEGNLENVRALLKAGALVNQKNKEGETAVDLTTDDEIEELLRSHGAIIEDN